MFANVLAHGAFANCRGTGEDRHGGCLPSMLWPKGQFSWTGNDRWRLIWQDNPQRVRSRRPQLRYGAGYLNASGYPKDAVRFSSIFPSGQGSESTLCAADAPSLEVDGLAKYRTVP